MTVVLLDYETPWSILASSGVVGPRS